MGFFIDKHNRRKSPIALVAFGTALGLMALFGLCYALLAEPLYHAVALKSVLATNLVHSLIVGCVGTAAGCLLFLLPDKRVAPYGFGCLIVVLAMFYAAAILLDGEARKTMLIFITLYGVAPVLVGNIVSWAIYRRLLRAHPDMNKRKSIQQELREAMEKEQEKQEPADAPAETAPEPPKGEFTGAGGAVFGPEGSGGPMAYRSAQEEAMLLYMDDDDETGDN